MSETEQKKQKKRSTLSWVAVFAGQKKLNYILSVIFAFGKVIHIIFSLLVNRNIKRPIRHGVVLVFHSYDICLRGGVDAIYTGLYNSDLPPKYKPVLSQIALTVSII